MRGIGCLREGALLWVHNLVIGHTVFNGRSQLRTLTLHFTHYVMLLHGYPGGNHEIFPLKPGKFRTRNSGFALVKVLDPPNDLSSQTTYSGNGTPYQLSCSLHICPLRCFLMLSTSKQGSTARNVKLFGERRRISEYS